MLYRIEDNRLRTVSGCADYRLWRMRAKVWIMKNHAAKNKETAKNEPTIRCYTKVDVQTKLLHLQPLW